jgi:HK97 family phage major capsid protein
MGMEQTYKTLLREVEELNAQVVKVWDSAGDEALTGEQKKFVIDTNKTIEEKEVAASELKSQMELRNGNMARKVDHGTPVNRMYFPNGDTKDLVIEDNRDIGSRVTEDAEFKSYMARIAPQGHIHRNTRIDTPPVQVGDLKALITGLSSTSGGALVSNDRLQIVDQGTFYKPLNILDIITRGTTNSDVVEYVRQGTHTNAAEVVAEATATSDGTGAKPESSMALSVVTENVKVIAHWVAATTRAIQDAGQLRTLIEQFLRYGLEDLLERQILEGDGVGENFTGIMNTTGTGTQAYDTSLLKTTRLARTKVMTEGRATPTAWVMHPTDWQSFDLLVDAESRYYFGGPMVMGTPRLWGLPVVESENKTAGYAIVADWRLAALWDRQQATISMSNSHSDFFIRNLVAILAEMRAAFGVIRPAAFIEVDLTP